MRIAMQAVARRRLPGLPRGDADRPCAQPASTTRVSGWPACRSPRPMRSSRWSHDFAAEPRTIAEVEGVAGRAARTAAAARHLVGDAALRAFRARCDEPPVVVRRPALVHRRLRRRNAPAMRLSRGQRLAYRYLEGVGHASARGSRHVRDGLPGLGRSRPCEPWPAAWSRSKAPTAPNWSTCRVARSQPRTRPHRRGSWRCGTTPSSPTSTAAGSSRRSTGRMSPAATGDVLPTLLVDGYVAGVWRPVEDGMEPIAFHHLPDRRMGGSGDRGSTRCSRSLTAANGSFTAVTPTGGPPCRPPRFACSARRARRGPSAAGATRTA